MNFKRTLTAAIFSLSAALPLAAFTPATHAQNYAGQTVHGAAQVQSFGVRSVPRVSPGSELEFTMLATPGASVTLQIAGASQDIRMSEESAGRYTATYTVRSRDRVTSSSLVTAKLVLNGQLTTAAMDQSVVQGAPSPVVPVASQITNFSVQASDRVRAGDDLSLVLVGTPGGIARVVLDGAPKSIALSETSPGHYEGSYTVRRQDRLDNGLGATGFLTVRKQQTSQRFERADDRQDRGEHRGHDRRDGDRNDRGDQRNDRGDQRSATPQPLRSVQACAACGVVQSVTVVEVNGSSPNVVGGVAGGVLGGVIGHQVGGGRGKDLATIAGAVGGAYLGNRAENNLSKSQEYRILVRLDDGNSVTITSATDPAIQAGVRVKVVNNALERL